MRQLKFRAWYNPYKHTAHGPLKFQQMVLNDALWFAYGTETEDNLDRLIMYPFETPFLNEDWTVEQYTGIVDCKGQEIYEGDILKCFDKHGVYMTRTSPVIFSNYGYGFVMDSSGRHNIDDKYGDYIPIQNNWMLKTEMLYEVVGNIHQN